METSYSENNTFVRSLQERALDKFIAEIDIRYDFQKHVYRGITLVVVNLSRAVMCESQAFYRYLFELIDDGADKIVVDLTSLEFIDSSFAGVLVAALRRVKNQCGDIRLVLPPNNSLSKQMFFTGVVKICKSFSTTKSALNSFELEKRKVTTSISHLASQR